MSSINIVLHQPQIPQNTGNIARTCAATGASLHLIGPLGFTIDDRKLKRAGLDYWHSLDIAFYDSLKDFYAKNPDARENTYYFTTKANRTYAAADYPKRVYLMFGKETAGLPEELLREKYEFCVRIPMREGQRSLNLSNTVAIAVYEVLRQHNFPGLLNEGRLTGSPE
ncbi:MAG: tRNA (cytidine(34)-2'-O)-methyltransferase [Clostridiales bacterium]|nr:tRNA (cytidine(34)-2'-O)-methyltransferase [Clostridiales bacterium]